MEWELKMKNKLGMKKKFSRYPFPKVKEIKFNLYYDKVKNRFSPYVRALYPVFVSRVNDN